MFYTVYKITNLVNNKFYIGCHKTVNINDTYMGSGLYIKRAIKKHNIENFKKEILFVFDDKEQMLQKEKELIGVICPEYNLHEGGNGGWEYINKNKNPNRTFKNQKLGSIALQKKLQNSIFKKQFGEKISKALMGRIGTFNGKKHTEGTKQRIRTIMKEKQKGKLNSMYGRKHSAETKEKIRQGVIKHNNK